MKYMVHQVAMNDVENIQGGNAEVALFYIRWSLLILRRNLKEVMEETMQIPGAELLVKWNKSK